MRVGIIGAGLMGRWHADAARRAGARVVAVVDLDEARAQALANRHPGAEARADGKRLLAEGRLDVAHVCTPLESHAVLAETAMEAGISVLVEKPLATDLSATRLLTARARETGTRLCPVHQFPFQRGFRRALAGLRTAGPLRHVEMTICSAGGTGRDEAGLHDLIAEVLPHPLSMTKALLPRGLKSCDWCVACHRAGEAHLHGRAGDVSVEVLLSMASRPTENSLRMRCENGTWEVDLFHGFGVLLPGGVSRRRKITLPFERATRILGHAASNLAGRALRREPAYPGLRTLVQEFYSAVRGEREPPISLEESEEIAGARDEILARLVKSDGVPSPPG